MKRITVGIFSVREEAEKAINYLHNKHGIPNEDISYIYRNKEGEVREVSAHEISSKTASEGAEKGASIGATVGAIAGIIAITGFAPIVGPLFAAGPLAAALGFTGVVGATAAGAVTGAAAGGLVGALTNVGIGAENSKRYADRVEAGNILVAVYADQSLDLTNSFLEQGATDVNVYGLTV